MVINMAIAIKANLFIFVLFLNNLILKIYYKTNQILFRLTKCT